MILVPLTIALFLFAVLMAAMGWETWATAAGGLAVLNQALVEYAVMRAPAEEAPTPFEGIDTGEPTLPGDDE